VGDLTITQIEQKANDIRKDIITMLEAAGSGHSAGPLGLADIFAALYFRVFYIFGWGLDFMCKFGSTIYLKKELIKTR
jgi:hypothetical protein